MVSGSYTWRRINNCCLLLSLLLLSCCHTEPAPPADTSDYGLRSGDVVCRQGRGFFSKYFRAFASQEQRYSHIGIIEVVRDSVFVIHTEASELTGVGAVKREPLARFLKHSAVFGFYRIDGADSLCRKIVARANEYYRQKVPFDLNFDAADDSELYCTELVAKTLNYAFDSILIKPELQLGKKKFYSLDAVYQNPVCSELKIKS